ncbi:hypothetical protein Purlil1_6697 [Purpureocillium lilacinum]|uniref:Uncharacterized protein n=1 Tax=Purpureocillium lilacinum TaxID=33203 RepID=A0ABR0BXM8_PURLI|nr:hypothetical protein Purlil1_6697 [Purpureocillium lilacinum]
MEDVNQRDRLRQHESCERKREEKKTTAQEDVTVQGPPSLPHASGDPPLTTTSTPPPPLATARSSGTGPDHGRSVPGAGVPLAPGDGQMPRSEAQAEARQFNMATAARQTCTAPRTGPQVRLGRDVGLQCDPDCTSIHGIVMNGLAP